MEIRDVTITKDSIFVEYFDEEPRELEFDIAGQVNSCLGELSEAQFNLIDIKKVNRGSYFEVNFYLYSANGEEVLLDMIIIDEDFIKHS